VGDAIALMKAVPASNPNKAIIQTKIAEYSGILPMPSGRRVIQQKPDRVVDFVPETRLHTCASLEHLHRSAAADAIKPNGVSSPNQTSS